MDDHIPSRAQGQVCDELERSFLLPHALACRYTICVFITFHKFQLSILSSSLSSSSSSYTTSSLSGGSTTGSLGSASRSRRHTQTITFR